MNVHVHSVDLHGTTAASRFPFGLNEEALAKDSSSLQRAPLAGLSNKPAPATAADDAADPFLPEKIKEIKTTAFAEEEDCWSLVATKELDDPKKSKADNADDICGLPTSKQLEELERMLHPQLLAPTGPAGSEAAQNFGANNSSSAAEVLPDDLSEFFDLQQQGQGRPHSRRSSLAPLLTAIDQQHSGANLHQASSARRSSLAPLLAALEGGGDAFGSSQFGASNAASLFQDSNAAGAGNGISEGLVAAAAAERRSSLAMAMASLDRRSSLAGGAGGAPAQRNSSMDLLLGGLFSSSSSASRRSSLALAQSHLLQDSSNAHHPPSYIQPLNDLGDVAVPSIGGMGRKRKLDEVGGNAIENRTDSEEALLAAARQQRRRSSMSLKASILRRMSGFSIGAGSVGHLSRSGSIGHLDQFDWNASSVPEDDDAANSVIPINAFPRRLSSMGMGSTEMLRRLSFGPLAASLFDPAEATPALPPGPGDAAAGLGDGGKDKADEVEPLQTHPLLHPLEVPLRERFGSNNPMAGQMAKKTTKKETIPQASSVPFDPSSRDRQRKNCHPPKPRRVSTASDSSSESSSSSSTPSSSVTAHAAAAAPKGPSLWQQQQELQQRQRQLRAASAKTASSRRAGGGYNNSSSSATSSSSAKVDIDPTRAATKLVVAMERSKKSQSLLHGWDRKMGLKKSHSKTMRMSRTSREKLLEEVGLQLLMAGGGIAAEMAAAQAAAR